LNSKNDNSELSIYTFLLQSVCKQIAVFTTKDIVTKSNISLCNFRYNALEKYTEALTPTCNVYTARTDWLFQPHPGCRQAKETVVIREIYLD